MEYTQTAEPLNTELWEKRHKRVRNGEKCPQCVLIYRPVATAVLHSPGHGEDSIDDWIFCVLCWLYVNISYKEKREITSGFSSQQGLLIFTHFQRLFCHIELLTGTSWNAQSTNLLRTVVIASVKVIKITSAVMYEWLITIHFLLLYLHKAAKGKRLNISI